MQGPGRTILFWTLVALFGITAPIVVMRARGYRFDFNRGVFVHSGTISTKINPPNVEIQIDGEIETSKRLNRINNSFNISGLIPKTYDIQISAHGFQPWSKKTSVHSGLASEFWNVLLVKNEYERDHYNTGGIEKFFISPKSERLIYISSKESKTSAKILNIQGKTIEAEFDFPEWQFIPDEIKENIEWSPEEDTLSIPLKKMADGKYAYFIASPGTKTFFNFNEFIEKEEIQNVRWDPKDKNYLFFLSDNSLYRANITDKNNIVAISENVSGYDLSHDAVYFLKMPNQLVYKSGLNGAGEKIQLTSSFPDSSSTQIEKIIVYDDLRMVFLDKNKHLFIYNRGEFETYFRKLANEIEGMHFSDDGKKLLHWTKNEISVLFLRQWTVQPFRNENEIQNITRYSDNLANVQWFKDYEHIMFSIGSQLKIIELDSRDHRNCMDIAKATIDNPFVIYNSYLEKLFFIDKNESGSELYSIIFPEKIPFFGVL